MTVEFHLNQKDTEFVTWLQSTVSVSLNGGSYDDNDFR